MNTLRFYDIRLLGRTGIEVKNNSVVRVLIGPEAVGTDTGDETELHCEAAGQLAEYAVGERTQFTVPVSPAGTAFQMLVWSAVGQIPWGTHLTYGDIARKLGRVGASQAVGNAVGKNPLPILIPCHRVIAEGGRLGGFRLGRELKEKLLNLERIECRDRKLEKI